MDAVAVVVAAASAAIFAATWSGKKGDDFSPDSRRQRERERETDSEKPEKNLIVAQVGLNSGRWFFRFPQNHHHVYRIRIF